MPHYCGNCARSVESENVNGSICCPLCGRVLFWDLFTDEPTFVKNAAGQSQLSGNFVKTIQSDYSVSRERILNEAYNGMSSMAYAMEVDGGDSVLKPALAFYTIAVERSFTRGRRKEQVEAACLYISCRDNKKPFLLIDFSEYLRINVYVLGAVFLQLCKLLSLEEHPIVQKPVDPSLFIHRFSERLLGGRNTKVERTALRIIASMKRDWMQTGRKPSGLCGAALYISALSHGVKCSKSDVVKVVHICEATLTKRLIEFENTESGGLTVEEFNMKAEELEREETSIKQPNIGLKAIGTNELLCEHKSSGELPFAHGLCKNCYADFIKISGGLEGGSEPPAFQRAERKRIMAREDTGKNADESSSVSSPCQIQNNNKHSNFEKEVNNPNASGNENFLSVEPELTEASSMNVGAHDIASDKLHGVDGMSPKVCDESDSFSDIDDVEVDGYLHNEEEKYYKKIIWEEMNKEYLEEQAAKEAAAAAAKEACEANFYNCPEDMQAAQELAAAASAAVAKSRKERQQKRAADARNSFPAQTAAEATRQMLTKKRLSSKINYDVLEKLFDESAAPRTKKIQTEPDSYFDDHMLHANKEDTELKDPYEDTGDIGGSYDKEMYLENVEGYEFDDDYGYEY